MNNAFGSRTAGTDSLPERLNRLEKEQSMIRAERLGRASGPAPGTACTPVSINWLV